MEIKLQGEAAEGGDPLGDPYVAGEVVLTGHKDQNAFPKVLEITISVRSKEVTIDAAELKAAIAALEAVTE